MNTKILASSIVALLAALAIATLPSCIKCWVMPPNELYLQINRNGQPIDNEELAQVKLCIEHETNGYVCGPQATATFIPDDTSFVRDINLMDETLINRGVLYSGYVGHETGTEMFIEFPNGDRDTLYVQSPRIPCKQQAKDPCHCQNPYKVLKINGVDAQKSTALKATDGKPVYVLNK